MENTDKKVTLEQIPADRSLVEELYKNKKITHEAKEYALSLLYPRNEWGAWISKICLAVGAALVLTGIVFFFAYNWNQISLIFKLGSIQFALIGCIAGAYYYSLKHIYGQVLLLSASVLVGVFMAVFGQIYQTGADSYQLFMMWSILILGWTILSNFLAQWILWLVITNLFVMLWWGQAALPSKGMGYMIYVYLSVLNGGVLLLREFLALHEGYEWLRARWVRLLLVITLLATVITPVLSLIISPGKASISVVLSAGIGLIANALIFYTYQHKLKDMWSLAACVFSLCIIVDVICVKLIMQISDAVTIFFLSGIITIFIFSYAYKYLREVAKELEAAHG